MHHTTGRVSEIRLGAGKTAEVCLICEESTVPSAGQYVLGFDPDDPGEVLSTPLFPIEMTSRGFWAAPLTPTRWAPGIKLNLTGPHGHGFSLPANIQRLGMAVLGDTVSRLLPLVHQMALTQGGMTLFTDLPLPKLPSALEVHPLAALKDALDWPDYLALDIPLESLPLTGAALGLTPRAVLPCPAQVLVTTPMPCAALARCGACAIPARRGWKLVCEDGPVFNLNDLKW